MQIKAHAKINWALNVVGKRPDGYHLLDMLVQRLELADELHIAPHDSLQLVIDGEGDLPTDEGNLVIKAARLLQAHCAINTGAAIRLIKHIPQQAGLGGGSADAAATLLALNELWGCGLQHQQLSALGAALGADVPLCMVPGLMRAQGIGEQISPLPGAQAFELLILKPETGLSTAKVFQQFAMQESDQAADIVAGIQVLSSAKPLDFTPLYNQLQPVAQRMLPEIAQALADLRAQGAVFAQMSGSGSAVFGVFDSKDQADSAFAALNHRWPICLRTKTIT